MENQEDKNGKLRAVDLLSAMKQTFLTETQIAADIKLLLDDYFVGTASLDGNRIEYSLLNGQRFKITVEKEKRKLFGKK